MKIRRQCKDNTNNNDRSLSFDIGFDSMNSIHYSSSNINLGMHTNHQNTIFLAVNKIGTPISKNIFNDASTNNSPHSTGYKKYKRTSSVQPSSKSFNIRTTSNKKYIEDDANIFEEDNSNSKYIKGSIDIEISKENDLIENKNTLDNELARLTHIIDEMKIKLTKYKQLLSSKQMAINTRINDIQRILTYSTKKFMINDSQEYNYFSITNNSNQSMTKDNTNRSIISSIHCNSNQQYTQISQILNSLSSSSSHPYTNANLLENEYQDLIKALEQLNSSLFNDIKLFEVLILNDPIRQQQQQHNPHSDANHNNNKSITLSIDDIKTIINTTKENFHTCNNDKTILMHKINENEYKLIQHREIKNLIKQDYYSHVEAITEYVVIYEELENNLESIKTKYHECYDDLVKDIELSESLVNIENQMSIDQELQCKLQNQIDLMSKELVDLGNQATSFIHKVENLNEMEEILRRDMICPEKSIYIRFQQNHIIDQNSNDSQDSLTPLIDFLKIFSISTSIDAVELDTYLKHIIDYEGILLQEIAKVIQAKHDYENLQKTLVQLQGKLPSSSSISIIQGDTERMPSNYSSGSSGSSSNSSSGGSIIKFNETFVTCSSRDNKKFIDRLQDEMINKKTQAIEFANKFQESRRIFVENLKESCSSLKFYQIMLDHSQLNFFEILKKVENFKSENILLNIVVPKLDTYKSLENISIELSQKLDELENLNNHIREKQRYYYEKVDELNELSNCLNEQKQRYQEIKELQESIENSCKLALVKNSEKIYQNYAIDENKNLKKIEFQYGNNSLTKLEKNSISSNGLNTPNNTNDKILAKRKIEISEIKESMKKIEIIRANKSIHIENEIKKNFNQICLTVHELETRNEILNNDFLDILDHEKKTIEYLEKILIENKSLLTIGEYSISKGLDRDMVVQGEGNNPIVKVNNNKYENLICEMLTKIQLYKTNILQILCNIVDRMLNTKYKAFNDNNANNEKLTPMQKLDLERINKKLQSELLNLYDTDKKHIEHYEKELLFKEDYYKEIQKKLLTLNKEIKSLANLYDSREKNSKNMSSGDFDNDISCKSSAIMNSLTFEIKKPKEKYNLNPNTQAKLSSRSIKNSPKYGTVTLDIKESINPKNNIISSRNSIKENSQTSRNTSIDINTGRSSICRVPSLANITNQTGSLSNVVFSSKSTQKVISGTQNQKCNSISSKTPVRKTQISNENIINQPISIHKLLAISDKSCIDNLIKDFECGLPIFKKFSTNSTLNVKNDNLTNIDQVNKLYGKRMIKLNKSSKTLDIIKLAITSARYTPEYSYEWKTIKNVFVPQKTLELIKSATTTCAIYKEHHNNNSSTENQMILQFALDTQNKGKIELIATEINKEQSALNSNV